MSAVPLCRLGSRWTHRKIKLGSCLMGGTFAKTAILGLKSLSIYRNPSVFRSRTKSNLPAFLLQGLYISARFLPTNMSSLS
jgi:hypothetical protein